MNRSIKIIYLFGIALVLNVTAQAGTKLIVSNYGTDSPNCGTADNPCRSISQAIQNAGMGDTIIVGPGRYGDLNNDGVFTDPGDEHPANQGMVDVSKAVTILSRDGADVTLIDAGSNEVSCVTIEASGAVFGAKGKGFTLVGTWFFNDGLVIQSAASRVIVAGNRAVGNPFDGFASTSDSSSNKFIGNTAVNCGHNGFDVGGSDYTFQGNVATGNAWSGFEYTGTNLVFIQNVASGNRREGLGAENEGSSSSSIMGNSFIGNTADGLDVDGLFTITGNNIFANSVAFNCGFDNGSVSNTAPKNFFGAATGPGADPADNVCATNVTFTPFATKEIKVKVIEP